MILKYSLRPACIMQLCSYDPCINVHKETAIGVKFMDFYMMTTCITLAISKVWYSSDVTLHSLVSNLLALSSNLLALVQSYSWRVLYYPQGTYSRLLDDLQKWFLTQLHMLAFGIMSQIAIMSTGQSSGQSHVAKIFVIGH